mmetsp:Transcript_17332/g.24076  ORF Transcript_17332/g.24076 Transcript_17332/m.24076 type:complete len:506 (-) Transcript_17332:52-1569(-)
MASMCRAVPKIKILPQVRSKHNVNSRLNHRFTNGTRTMSTTKQGVDFENILNEVKNSPSDMVKLSAFDIDGVPRGKYLHKNKFASAAKNGSAFCSVVFGWDCADVLYDNTKKVGWHMGYADFPTTVDLNTFRKVPWENDRPFFIMDFNEPNAPNQPLDICPRNLLKKILGDMEKAHGYKALVGAEYEFFNYQESPQSLQDKKYVDVTPLTPGMFGYSHLRAGQNMEYMDALVANLTKFGVPIEGIHTETGPGVYEAAIQYSEALEAADRAVLFKMGTKDIAGKFGIIPTFMAKPNKSLPGCGGHTHQNLVDKNGNNIFYDSSAPHGMSETFKHFLAGQMHCLPEIMPMFAPTVNSYKRFVEGYWAPTTPTWGVENRTVSFRVIPGGKATRIEVRVSGADMNPYLTIAASLASGLYGIKHKMALRPQVGGNAYGTAESKQEIATNPRDHLPRNLFEAAKRMQESKLAVELFGSSFVEHFVATRLWEWRQFQTAVTNWETERYFEII